MRRGEVWWLEPPTEKARPYLILTRDLVVERLDKVLAAPTTRRARGIPTEVPLDEDDGMPASCVVSLDNTQLIPRAYCTRRLTVLGTDRLDEVCRALRIAVDC